MDNKTLTETQLKSIKKLAYELMPVSHIANEYGVVNPHDSLPFKRAVETGEAMRYRDEQSNYKKIEQAFYYPYRKYQVKEHYKEYQYPDGYEPIAVTAQVFSVTLSKWSAFKKHFMDFSFTFELKRLREIITKSQLEKTESSVKQSLVRSWSPSQYEDVVENWKSTA